MGLLTGKTAVITGSSRGLGLAIAEAYAREDAAVVIASRSAAAVEKAVRSLTDQGLHAAGLACDAADLEQVQALAELAVARFGGLDIWVNNAGTGAPYGPTVSIDPDLFKRVVNTNIYGVYHGSLTAMRYFTRQGSGKLINLVGRGEKKPVPLQNAYASSKAWVRSFTLALAAEYRESGVGVYAFNPGLVLTEMLTEAEAVAGYARQMSPLNTVIRLWGNPPEVPAQKALWLASSATDGKTGLAVDVLSPGMLVGGALRELGRRILGRPPRFPETTFREVPPFNSD
jgi:NAD(P)-dependent dehydrogenase (short-subunit alcohol dehydrogenase family)